MVDFRIGSRSKVADASDSLFAFGVQKQSALLGLLLIHAGNVMPVTGLAPLERRRSPGLRPTASGPFEAAAAQAACTDLRR